MTNTKTTTKAAKPKVLTANQSELKDYRDTFKALREKIRVLAATVKAEKIKIKADKQAKTKARKDAAIAKARAKLEALMSPKAGAKAAKANRKPGPAKVTKGPVA